MSPNEHHAVVDGGTAAEQNRAGDACGCGMWAFRVRVRSPRRPGPGKHQAACAAVRMRASRGSAVMADGTPRGVIGLRPALSGRPRQGRRRDPDPEARTCWRTDGLDWTALADALRRHCMLAGCCRSAAAL